MKRLILATVGVLLVVFVVWLVAFMECVYWVGGYQLTVRITRPANGSSVRILRYVLLANREEAERIMNRLPKADKAADWDTEVVPITDPATGLSIPREVRVFAYGSTSMIGTELQHFRVRFLVVVADLDDGRQVGVIAELPDAKHVGEVIVVLP